MGFVKRGKKRRGRKKSVSHLHSDWKRFDMKRRKRLLVAEKKKVNREPCDDFVGRLLLEVV